MLWVICCLPMHPGAMWLGQTAGTSRKPWCACLPAPCSAQRQQAAPTAAGRSWLRHSASLEPQLHAWRLPCLLMQVCLFLGWQNSVNQLPGVCALSGQLTAPSICKLPTNGPDLAIQCKVPQIWGLMHSSSALFAFQLAYDAASVCSSAGHPLGLWASLQVLLSS